jgi:hypothetical protein
MNYMKRILFLLLITPILFAGCNDDGNDNDALDVSGTWRAPVTFQSCSPADVCSAAGFTAGSSANAILVIMQSSSNRRQLDGSYTYEGAGITAAIDGEIAGNQLSMDGSASNLFGTITVNVGGQVSGNTLNATVMHQINLTDGRSGTVSGTGTFVR